MGFGPFSKAVSPCFLYFKTKQPRIKLAKCLKSEGRNTKPGDIKHSVKMRKDFPKLPGYLKIKLPFQPRDSILKDYEETAICDCNIPVL